MHLVTFILPVETIVSIFSWATFFLSGDDMLNSRFPSETNMSLFFVFQHVSLHLLPFLGLASDYVSGRGHYKYSRGQLNMLVFFLVFYTTWAILCYHLDTVMTSNFLRLIYNHTCRNGRTASWED